MAIKGLPGWEWHYRYENGKQVERYATDTAGNRYTQRDVQSLQHGEVYEKRVPQEQRKKYKRKVGKSVRHGPFHSIQEIIDYKKIGDKKSVWVQAHGTIRKGKKYKGKGGSSWRSVGSRKDFKDTRTALDMIEHGLHDTTPEIAKHTMRLQENLHGFTEVNEYFLYEREQ